MSGPCFTDTQRCVPSSPPEQRYLPSTVASDRSADTTTLVLTHATSGAEVAGAAIAGADAATSAPVARAVRTAVRARCFTGSPSVGVISSPGTDELDAAAAQSGGEFGGRLGIRSGGRRRQQPPHRIQILSGRLDQEQPGAIRTGAEGPERPARHVDRG